MSLSSSLLLLSADDTLHALASTVFTRMLQQEDFARVDDPFEPERLAQRKDMPSSLRPGALAPEAAHESQTNGCCNELRPLR